MPHGKAQCAQCGVWFTWSFQGRGRPSTICSDECRCERERERGRRRDAERTIRRDAKREGATIRCAECGRDFPARKGNPRYCAPCARVAYLRRRRREYRPAPKPPCGGCGGPIAELNGRRRYCSDECQVRSNSAAQRWKLKGLEPRSSDAGLCALCGEYAERRHIDHDHACCPGDKTCGECTRGLLCRRCNVGLGMFRDDPELLTAAAYYVERFRNTRRPIAV